MAGDFGDGYRSPSAVDRAFASAVRGLARAGISLLGSRILEVAGRRSGVPRQVVVNPIAHEGARYLVAPRGNTQWARNLRAAGGHGVLILGRRREPFVARELADELKAPVLRAYLRRFSWEVGRFFGGVRADARAEALAGIASAHPVFRIEP
jgi:deazaflavin-dependent oxidoreductase (nitroreductase family)